MEILKLSIQYLKKNRIDNPRLNAELIFCKVLNLDRLNLYLNFDKPLNEYEISKLREFIKRRSNNEPIQYILEETNFFGYNFVIEKNVFIPRPETELLVEEFLGNIDNSINKSINVLDICFGSGCISLSIYLELIKIGIQTNINGIDISSHCVALANLNKKRLIQYTSEINYIQFDFFKLNSLQNNLNFIIMNPPYIPYDVYLNLEPEVKEFEPENSLTDGKNGLSYYIHLMELIKNNSEKVKCFCEIGFNQKPEISKLLESNGISNFIFKEDLNNIPRILIFEN